MLRPALWYLIALLPAWFVASVLLGVTGEIVSALSLPWPLWSYWAVPLATGAATYGGIARWLRINGIFAPTLVGHLVRAAPLYLAIALLGAYTAAAWSYRDFGFVAPIIGIGVAVAVGGVGVDAVATFRRRLSRSGAPAA